jgi:hypothetical protein
MNTKLINNNQSNIITALYHQWNVKHLREYDVNCFLLNWKPEYLKKQLLISDNQINQYHIDYEIRYLSGNCKDDINIAKKAALSFRNYTMNDNTTVAVVLIKFIF